MVFWDELSNGVIYVYPRSTSVAMATKFGTGPDLAGGRPGAQPGPSGVFGISKRDWLLNYRVLKIEGFGGRPPVDGRPGARGPPPPLNPALFLDKITIFC